MADEVNEFLRENAQELCDKHKNLAALVIQDLKGNSVEPKNWKGVLETQAELGLQGYLAGLISEEEAPEPMAEPEPEPEEEPPPAQRQLSMAELAAQNEEQDAAEKQKRLDLLMKKSAEMAKGDKRAAGRVWRRAEVTRVRVRAEKKAAKKAAALERERTGETTERTGRGQSDRLAGQVRKERKLLKKAEAAAEKAKAEAEAEAEAGAKAELKRLVRDLMISSGSTLGNTHFVKLFSETYKDKGYKPKEIKDVYRELKLGKSGGGKKQRKSKKRRKSSKRKRRTRKRRTRKRKLSRRRK